MNGRQFQQPAAGGFGLSGPVPRDVVVLLAVVLATFSLQFFESTRALHQLLVLTPGVWRSGMLWQLVTYPFAGVGAPSFWFLLALLILFMFTRTVFLQLGRRAFWKWLLTVCVASALIAAVAGLVVGPPSGPVPMFSLMQGQYMLMTVVIAAFATMNRNATILLFFVLPVQAKWFLLLELLFAFMGFLSTHDLAGFLGLAAGVGLTFAYLSAGSPVGQLRRLWLQVQEQWIRLRLRSMRKKRGIRLVDEPEDDDRWVH